LKGSGEDATVERAALVRTARKIMQGELHLPEYVFSRPEVTGTVSSAFPRHVAQVEPGTAARLSAKVASELARWSMVVKDAGLAPNESRLATVD
jgi:hypothetical protein